MAKRALVLFSKNLRTQDNPLLHKAAHEGYEIIGISFVPLSCSEIHKQFYIESALELREKFNQANIPFFLIRGNPTQELPRWFALNSFDVVLSTQAYNSREISVSEKVAFQGSPPHLRFWDQTLIDRDLLPFQIDKFPLIYSHFKKEVLEKNIYASVISSSLDGIKGFTPRVPENTILVENSEKKFSSPFDIKPGESGAHARLKEYFDETKSILQYKETRNGMLKKNDSSKLSIAMSCGCLSPRQIYAELKKVESEYGPNESTHWYELELLWRDYFKFLALRLGDQLFSVNGIRADRQNWSSDDETFQKWCQGNTTADFIDANMIELNTTGWMSNRGRQNVASYLAKTLQHDWTKGAEYFESRLIDYDIENNWGNWLYLSGSGTDPRNRIFNYQKQADMYDSDLSYRNTWLKSKGRQ